jgi:hypothetical protein
VVNIVLPEFGSGFPADDHGFELGAVTQKFYQHFEDTYDSIAVVPQDTFIGPYGAFHRNVQNQVRGIGLSVFDNSPSYGSQSHRLQSVELFLGTSLTDSASSSHEIAHQWGEYIDWSRLTGLPRAGHQPESHDPLWDGGETLVGAVLLPTRRVHRDVDGWTIERPPAPAHFHPVTLYAMGLIGRENVPEITLFDEQSQFDPSSATAPEPGRVLTGATRTATIFNVIGMLGERSGPVMSQWHRATVVVSRTGLLSQREMDYWTYFSQRLDDPNKTGLIGYEGIGSFEAATAQRIDLQTDVRPARAARIDPPLMVDAPDLGRRDWRDVVFDAPIPTRYQVGDRIRWSGIVNAPDRNDINAITIRLWKNGGTTETAIRVSASVSSASSFSAETQFRAEHRGVYQMEVYLFWPGSGVQASRMAISPITIE